VANTDVVEQPMKKYSRCIDRILSSPFAWHFRFSSAETLRYNDVNQPTQCTLKYSKCNW